MTTSPLFAQIRDHLAEVNPEAILFDGYEDALVGVVERFGVAPIALYDRARCIRVLVERDGMTEEEAEEFFSFNTEGCWAGEHTPAFLVVPG